MASFFMTEGEYHWYSTTDVPGNCSFFLIFNHWLYVMLTVLTLQYNWELSILTFIRLYKITSNLIELTLTHYNKCHIHCALQQVGIIQKLNEVINTKF